MSELADAAVRFIKADDLAATHYDKGRLPEPLAREWCDALSSFDRVLKDVGYWPVNDSQPKQSYYQYRRWIAERLLDIWLERDEKARLAYVGYHFRSKASV